MMKKIISLFLSTVLLLSITSGINLSAYAETSGDWEYTVSNGKAVINSYNGYASKVSVPSFIGGYPVIEIGCNAFHECSITEVEIPKSIKEIGPYAFEDCSRLKKVVCGSKIIGACAFNRCYALEDLTLPCDFELGVEAFFCTEIKKLRLTEASGVITSDYFSEQKFNWNKQNHTKPSMKNWNNTYLEEVYIDDGVINIPDCFFKYCGSLTKVSMDANSIWYIGYEAFYGCGALKQIIWRNGKKVDQKTADKLFENCFEGSDYWSYTNTYGHSGEINARAFMYSGITEMNIPSQFYDLDEDCFYGSLKKLPNLENISSIGEGAFYNVEDKEIVIPCNVEYVSAYAFGKLPDIGKKFYVAKETELDRVTYYNIEFFEDLSILYYTGTEKELRESWYYYTRDELHDPYHDCCYCNFSDVFFNSEIAFKKVHKTVVTSTPATFSENGTRTYRCSKCGVKKTFYSAKLSSPALSKVTAGKKSFTAKWKKINGVDGYEIQYSLKKNMKSSKKKTVKTAVKTKLTVKKLKSKKKYYVRIRAYKKINGKIQYSKWSAKKTVTVK